MNGPKRILLLFPVFALVLAPVGLYGQQEANGPSSAPLKDQTNAGVPPVGQALVPEGVFASELVKSLKIGQAQDEAQAENMLSAVGIEPKNGWIAGYPVTPPIVGEIEKSVAAAADAGKLGMNRDQSLRMVGDLKTKLGLNVTPGGVSPSLAGRKPTGPIVYNIIYRFTDKDGVVHFTNKYESIPKEYRDKVEIIREVIPSESSSGPALESAETQSGEAQSAGVQSAEAQGDNYPPNPSPEVVNNYYYDEGPPVITYYAPPSPYYYLYAWVPYPFWCSGFFFSGFFILHDFHRHVFFHRHPFFVSNHISLSNRVFVVDPVSRSFRRSTFASRAVNSSRVFSSPGVQSSARTIVSLNQNRPPFSPSSRMTNMGTSPSTSTGRLPGSIGQGTFHGGMSQPRGNFVSPRAIPQGRTFSLSARSFSPAQPRVFSAPVGRGPFGGGFGGHHDFSGHGGFSGGFHHGGGGFGGHFGGHR